ncbi:MAG: hypothetical protein JWO75_4902 [Actinomycetia bacterium]|jgi:hypothetical protein|nr:hypothetical protein [Actinomycetes bacterium]
MPPTGITVLHLTRGARVRWELRKLRRAQRAGRPLDALTAAARIHALAVRPNMRHGGWPRAQASSERVLSRMPARRTPGYAPRLRGVIECLHADAARAAREAGDLQRAKLHLTALTGYLRDRRAPVVVQAAVMIDLAEVCIAAGDARAGGRILAGLGPLITGYSPRPAPGPRPASAPGRATSAGRAAAVAVPAQRQASD